MTLWTNPVTSDILYLEKQESETYLDLVSVGFLWHADDNWPLSLYKVKSKYGNLPTLSIC